MNTTPSVFYAPLTYDAVWSLALALNASQNSLPPDVKLENFRYDDIDMTNIFMEKMNKLDFQGIMVIQWKQDTNVILQQQVLFYIYQMYGQLSGIY